MLIIIDTALKNITRMLIPVSLLALSAKPFRYSCTCSPAAGTKLLKTNSISVVRASAKAGNAAKIASEATISGTSDTSVV